MYQRWAAAGGWRTQVMGHEDSSLMQRGAKAFRRLPGSLADVAVKFAADSQLTKSVDDTAVGYGLVLEPLYQHLNSQRLGDEMDADLHALLGN